MKKVFWQTFALLVVASMILSACGAPAPAATEAPVAATEAPAVATEAPAVATEAPAATGTLLERAYAGEFSGTVVTATGPFVDADAQKFDATMASFEEATGIDIQYQGSKEFEASIKASIDAGSAADLIDFPQPGLLATFVAQGKIMDVSQYLEMEAVAANYNQSWLDMATMEGPDGPIMAGIWERVNGKSLVWYPKAAWDEAGYAIPTTWEEMITLMD